MNTKDFLRLGVPLGKATRRADFNVARLMNVSLDPNRWGVHCQRRLMSTTLTTRLLTRTVAGLVIVPRRCRMSWQVIKNYQIIGGQEELLN